MTIVFDLDGTLIDTAPDLIRSVNRVMTETGYAPVNQDLLRPFISFGAKRMIEEALISQDQSVSKSNLDAYFAKMISIYRDNIASHSRPFPHLTNQLIHWRAQGAALAVCTNKREDLALSLLNELDLSHHFKAITGRDTFAVCKPDPAHLLGTIERAGGTPGRSVMIGDSDTDVKTARAANVPVIGVTFGYTDTPMADLAPDAIIESYDELPDALHAVGYA